MAEEERGANMSFEVPTNFVERRTGNHRQRDYSKVHLQSILLDWQCRCLVGICMRLHREALWFCPVVCVGARVYSYSPLDVGYWEKGLW